MHNPVRWLFPCLVLPLSLAAQDRLKSMPGYERYQKVNREMTNLVNLGAPSLNWRQEEGRFSVVTWTNGGTAFDYRKDGKRFRYDIGTRSLMELPPPPTNGSPARVRIPERPARGRQYPSANSPDNKWKASYRDRNLWLSETNGTNEMAITTDGREKTRIKFGTASWVYGEELSRSFWPLGRNVNGLLEREQEIRVKV